MHKRERTSELVDYVRVTYGRNLYVDGEQMTEWQSDDIVTTTFGTIQNSRQESFEAGVKAERKRIVELLTNRASQQHTSSINNDYVAHRTLIEAVNAIEEIIFCDCEECDYTAVIGESFCEVCIGYGCHEKDKD